MSRAIVDTWIVNLDEYLDDLKSATCLREMLAESEKREALRLHRARDRDRLLCRRTVRRIVISTALSLPPSELVFDRQPSGRPGLTGSAPVAFSESHSEEYYAIAICEKATVGIDIEKTRDFTDMHAWAAQAMSPRECDAWKAQPNESEKVRVLLELWTRKEAVLKAWGIGLQRDPCTLDLLPTDRDAGASSMQVSVDGIPVQILALPEEPTVVGAIALWNWSGTCKIRSRHSHTLVRQFFDGKCP